MTGLHKYPDLQNHLSNFTAVLNKFREIEQKNQELEFTNEKLTQENKSLKNANETITLQLKNYTGSTENQQLVADLYLALREKYKTLEDETAEVQQEKTVLAENLKSKADEAAQDYLQQIKKLQEEIRMKEEQFDLKTTKMEENLKWKADDAAQEYLRQIKKLQEEMRMKEEQFTLKKNELYTELLAQQATNDLRLDEIQSQLQNGIKELTMQRDEALQRCTSHNQFVTFKSRSTVDSDMLIKRIKDLETQLQLTQQQLELAQKQISATNSNRSSSGNAVKDYPTVISSDAAINSANSSKYPSLTSNEEAARGFQQYKIDIAGRDTHTLGVTAVRRNNYVPPPIPLNATGRCGAVRQRPTIVKKRKLYNLNMDYLHYQDDQE